MKKKFFKKTLIFTILVSVGLATNIFQAKADYPGTSITDNRSVRGMISSYYGSAIANSQEENNLDNQNGLVLFRVVRDCATGKPIDNYSQQRVEFSPHQWKTGYLQMQDLEKTGYQNYTCASRYQEQCINDGSFDSYYDEYCTRESKINTESFTSHDKKILYRIVRDCTTKKPIGQNYSTETTIENGSSRFGKIQKINLDTFRAGTYQNYTCASRYQEQCKNDGTADSYYDEWCENE